MLKNQTNQTEDLFSCYSPSVTGYRYFAVLWGCAVTITGTPGNLMTILAFLSDTNLRTRFNALIVNLAVADLLFCTILQPILVDSFLHLRWRSGPLWCRIFGLLYLLSNSVSIITLCLVAFSRYLLVVKRALFDHIFSNYGLVLLLISIWALCLASFGPLWPVYVFVPQVCTCSFHRTRGHPYTTILLFFYFLGGLGCIGTFCILICRRVKVVSQALLRYRLSQQSSRGAQVSPSQRTDESCIESGGTNMSGCELSCQAEQHQNKDGTTYKNASQPFQSSLTALDSALDSNPASASPTQIAAQLPNTNVSRDDKEMTRVTYMCLVVFLCFSLCFVPILLLNIADIYNRGPQLLYMICLNLNWLNSCINPILYAVMNRQFRKAYIVLLNRVASSATCLWTGRKTDGS